jgi:hypothetical protein
MTGGQAHFLSIESIYVCKTFSYSFMRTAYILHV